MSAIGDNPNTGLRIAIAVAAVVVLAAAVIVSKRRESVISDTPAEASIAA
jgi:K(+)-stimulated pyrophosphate-energized sodium pump